MLSLQLKGSNKDTPEDQKQQDLLKHTLGDQKDQGGRELPQEIFHVLCGVILSALVLNIVLIYFQLWRPFKAEQRARNEDIECDAEIVEEGSHTALLAPIGTILCLVLSAIVSTMIYFYFYYKKPSLEDINFN